MNSKIKMSGRLIAAARALTGISQVEFAAAAGLSVMALRLMEAGLGAWRRSLAPAHARVVSNARRLNRRVAPRARLR